MSSPDPVTGAVLGLATAAASAVGLAASSPPEVRGDLDALMQRTVLFGHQSVGANVIEGVELLAQEHGVRVRAVDVSTGGAVPPAGKFRHVFLGANGDPAGKLEAFARLMTSPETADVDTALVKLCFVDFDGDADVPALFAAYRRMVEKIRAARPDVTLVHVTTPLTVVQRGPKAWAKRLVGRRPYGLVENARREQYNGLLRRAYGATDPVFDLARVESTRPDGSAESAELNGQSIPALAPEYTDDGGHLNAEGRRRAARALLAALEAIPARRVPSP